MYQPAHFVESRPDVLAEVIAAHPLAALCRNGPHGPDADHIPLRWDPQAQCLRGHVARANSLWREADGQRVLAVFQAEQGYVSPSWYASKAATHKVVPTWNYAVVHAHGLLRARDDEAWLHTFLSGLTDRHEAGRAQPWSVNDAPTDYMAQMLKAVVGIEIAVDKLEGKFKLSQNRSAADRQGVVVGLAAETASPAHSLARRMQAPGV